MKYVPKPIDYVKQWLITFCVFAVGDRLTAPLLHLPWHAGYNLFRAGTMATSWLVLIVWICRQSKDKQDGGQKAENQTTIRSDRRDLPLLVASSEA